MSCTKKKLIDDALEELGLASYNYDITPDEYHSVAAKLDAMMARWNVDGIRIGFPLSNDSSNIDINQETFLPDTAIQAVYLNLAVRIAPSFGKIVSAETKQAAISSYRALIAMSIRPKNMLIKGLPYGAGNKPTRGYGQFIDEKDTSILAGEDNEIDFI